MSAAQIKDENEMDYTSEHEQEEQDSQLEENSSVASDDGLSSHFSDEGSAKSDITAATQVSEVPDSEDDDGPPDVVVYARDETPARTIGSIKVPGGSRLFLNQYGPNKSPIYRFEKTVKGNVAKIPELSGPGNQITLIHQLTWENVCGVSAVATKFDDMKFLGPDFFDATIREPIYVRVKLRYPIKYNNGEEETVRRSHWVPRPWVRQHYGNPNAGVEKKMLRKAEEDIGGHESKKADELLLQVAKVTQKRFKTWEDAVIAEGREDSPDKTPEPAWVPGQQVPAQNPSLVRRHGDRPGRSRREGTENPSQVLVRRSRSHSQSSASSADSSQGSASSEAGESRRKKRRNRAKTPADKYIQAKKAHKRSGGVDVVMEARLGALIDNIASQVRSLALAK